MLTRSILFKIVAALFLGVLIMVLNSCEEQIPVDAMDEHELPVLLDQEKSDDDLNIEDRKDLIPGLISPPVFTDLMRKLLEEEFGKNADDIPYVGLSEEGEWFVGEEAWERFMKDREIEGVPVGSDGNPVFEPDPQIEGGFLLQSNNGSATPASTDFTIVDISNPPSSGSVTVQYEGEQVTTNYSEFMNEFAVANALSSDINNHPNIQLSAVVSGSTVTVTEKRAGCEHNGNTVWVSHTTGTHISVNGDQFFMAGATDDGSSCDPPDIPDTPQLISPPDEAINQPVELTLEWQSSDGAVSYGLQVATDAGFSNVVIDETGISSTSGIITGLSYTTTYYWRVNSTNQGGTSDWSDEWSFTTSDPPLLLAWGSFIDLPPFGNYGQVNMGSYSQASEPIDYIDVIGTSMRDFLVLAQLGDGGSNRSFAVVGTSEFKSSFDPESFWQQLGDHGFIDPAIPPNGSLNTGSSESETF